MHYLRPQFYIYRYIRNLEKLRLGKFKNFHASKKRCFLIGNGPSIKQQDLTQLNDEIVFVTNHFVLHNQYKDISPDYYCVCDHRMFEGGANEEWATLMYEKANRTIKFFPLSARINIKSDSRFDNTSTYYLNHTSGKIWDLNKMVLDPRQDVYSGDTIIIDYCIPLAFYMGFTEIFLLGCDCDYGLDKDKDFSRSYFFDSKLATSERQTVKYLQKEWSNNVFKSYKIAKDILENRGCKIYNSTLGGKLEVFERVELKKIFQN